jgi:hypothetical protein
VLVATDYFTKWTEAVALKNMTHKEVIEFITKHIIHRFGIPQTLTIDQGTSFMSKEVCEFAELYRIKLLNCDTPVSPRVSLKVLTHKPSSYVNQS